MGSRHADVVSRSSHSDLVLAIDTNLATAQTCAARYGCRYARLLDEHVDVAIIATPSAAHFSATQHARTFANWCLVEKPFVLPGQELSDAQILVSHPERFHAALPEHAPEEISTFVARREGPPPPQMPADDVFLDLLVHDLDLLCQWTTPVALLDASCERTADGRVEAGTARFALPSGGVATLHVSRMAKQRQRTLQWTSQGEATSIELTTTYTPSDPTGTLDRQWDALLMTMRGETPVQPPATCADGSLVVALAAQALRYATQHARG